MADYPSDTIRNIKFGSNQLVDQSTSESGKMTAVKYGGQNWVFGVTHAPMQTAAMRALDVFGESKGTDTAFTFSPPDKAVNYGTASGTLRINGTPKAGDAAISIDGLTAGQTYLASAMFNVSTHSKAYKNTATAIAGSGSRLLENGDYRLLESGDRRLLEQDGQIDLTIFPALIEDVADNSSINYGSNLTFTVKITSKNSYMVSPPDIYQISHNMKEYIS